MFFTFPEDARSNARRQAVEFGVEIGEWSGSRGACLSGSCPSGPPKQGVEAYHLQRTRFESIAERKLRRRQLTENGNVEISGCDLCRVLGGTVPAARGASQIDPFRIFSPALPWSFF